MSIDITTLPTEYIPAIGYEREYHEKYSRRELAWILERMKQEDNHIYDEMEFLIWHEKQKINKAAEAIDKEVTKFSEPHIYWSHSGEYLGISISFNLKDNCK